MDCYNGTERVNGLRIVAQKGYMTGTEWLNDLAIVAEREFYIVTVICIQHYSFGTYSICTENENEVENEAQMEGGQRNQQAVKQLITEIFKDQHFCHLLFEFTIFTVPFILEMWILMSVSNSPNVSVTDGYVSHNVGKQLFSSRECYNGKSPG